MESSRSGGRRLHHDRRWRKGLRPHPSGIDGRPVELDFAGVEVFAAPFFDAAVGRLLADFTPEDLNRLLKVSHLVPEEVEALKLLIEDSARYYRDPAFRQALDEVIMEHAEER